MADDREVELKLEVPARGLHGLERSALLRRARGRKSRELVSVYYDTDKQKLRRRGFSLRVRRIGDRHVQTIKRTGASNQIAFDRVEWEKEIGGGDPDLNAARHTPLKSVLGKNTRRAMKPIFETRVLRTTYPMRIGSSEVEVSVDKGRIHAGKKSAALCEVELELKRGHSPELFRLAHRLADNIPVEVALKSKSERGYELVNGDVPSPVKSVSASLSRKLTTEAAFKSVARACLHHLIANVPVLRAGNPEGLHQARVSLRRLRAAISLFSGILHDGQTETIKRELKWLTGELGQARELDVFMKKVAQAPSRTKRRNKGLGRLKDDLTSQRKDAFERAQSGLATVRYRALALDLVPWIESGDWTRNDDDLRHALRQRPIAKTATEQLDRRWKKILKRGKRLGSLSSRQRHKLRIAAKKLRYASEFFAGAFRRKGAVRRQKRFVADLKRLQDCLGDLNDIVVNEAVSARLARQRRRNPTSEDQASKAFSAGRLAGAEEARFAAVLKSTGKGYRTFSKTMPFWNDLFIPASGDGSIGS